MSYRCINAFEFDRRIYPGGVLVADEDPILKTHRPHFAKVEDIPFGFAHTETATAAPGERRTPQLPGGDAEAWLAAEKRYEEDVQAWLLAEEEHQTAVAAAAHTESTNQAGNEDAAARRTGPRRPRGQEGKN
ncbi:hypothetical protein H7J86_24535 [Mycobacterium hackensackense]|uniref:hypothetical protein n=1 Tax=Mycobacterium hackensackense TaxID=228909 RepID=UPI002265966C|nr:hypothetical protein [Mycobacterium hackensackense]MCV7255335.1 hypothetical protein [Mycobacterium hackensackense]